MTSDQAKQYEVCKTRRHEEAPVYRGLNYQNQGMQAANPSPWKICRWCGIEYQEVQETRQVERQ